MMSKWNVIKWVWVCAYVSIVHTKPTYALFNSLHSLWVEQAKLSMLPNLSSLTLTSPHMCCSLKSCLPHSGLSLHTKLWTCSLLIVLCSCSNLCQLYREDALHDIKEKDTLTAYEMQTMLGKVKKSIKTDLKGLRQWARDIRIIIRIVFLHGLLLDTDLNKATICRTILCRSNATFTSVHKIMPQVCICHIYSKCEIPQ